MLIARVVVVDPVVDVVAVVVFDAVEAVVVVLDAVVVVFEAAVVVVVFVAVAVVFEAVGAVVVFVLPLCDRAAGRMAKRVAILKTYSNIFS